MHCNTDSHSIEQCSHFLRMNVDVVLWHSIKWNEKVIKKKRLHIYLYYILNGKFQPIYVMWSHNQVYTTLIDIGDSGKQNTQCPHPCRNYILIENKTRKDLMIVAIEIWKKSWQGIRKGEDHKKPHLGFDIRAENKKARQKRQGEIRLWSIRKQEDHEMMQKQQHSVSGEQWSCGKVGC